MMPSSVLRSFLLFIVSWAVLGVGVYLAYDLIQGSRPSAGRTITARLPGDTVPDTVPDPLNGPVIEPDTNAPDSTTTTDQPLVADRQIVDPPRTVVVHTRESDWSRWAKLAAVFLCFGFTFGGRMPLRWMMKHGKATARITEPTETFVVDRPDGARLHGEIYGSAQKPTLLLTHGWSLDSSAWLYIRDSLASRYRVVVWDLPGLGKSRGPSNNDYSLEKLANDLNAVLEHVSPNGPAILIGHSIGGMTEQTFCRLHKAKLGQSVKGIVLLHTTYTNPLATNMLAGITKPLEPLVSLINLVMIPLAPIMWLSNWQSYFNGSAHWAARFESFTGKQTWEQLDHSAKLGARAWPSVVARGNFGMMKFNEERSLPEVQVPVLVVSGNHDRLTVPSASGYIAQLLPNDTQLADNGGHLGYWEYNDQVSEAIHRFAAKVTAVQSASLAASER